jgi:AbrB family looped-hinge helix DNA binding protein
MNNSASPGPGDHTCGTAVVGERGQIVIPADLRKALNIHPGSRLLIWNHPSNRGLMMFPVESVREFMDVMLATLERAEQQRSEEHDEE